MSKRNNAVAVFMALGPSIESVRRFIDAMLSAAAEQAREIVKVEIARLLDPVLHPNGRCTCGGEGKCPRCLPPGDVLHKDESRDGQTVDVVHPAVAMAADALRAEMRVKEPEPSCVCSAEVRASPEHPKDCKLQRREAVPIDPGDGAKGSGAGSSDRAAKGLRMVIAVMRSWSEALSSGAFDAVDVRSAIQATIAAVSPYLESAPAPSPAPPSPSPEAMPERIWAWRSSKGNERWSGPKPTVMPYEVSYTRDDVVERSESRWRITLDVAERMLRDARAERDHLRADLSRISGILANAGDVQVEPYPEGVAQLVRQRNAARDLTETLRRERDEAIDELANMRAERDEAREGHEVAKKALENTRIELGGADDEPVVDIARRVATAWGRANRDLATAKARIAELEERDGSAWMAKGDVDSAVTRAEQQGAAKVWAEVHNMVQRGDVFGKIDEAVEGAVKSLREYARAKTRECADIAPASVAADVSDITRAEQRGEARGIERVLAAYGPRGPKPAYDAWVGSNVTEPTWESLSGSERERWARVYIASADFRAYWRAEAERLRKEAGK
jgi:hypothetical protein